MHVFYCMLIICLLFYFISNEKHVYIMTLTIDRTAILREILSIENKIYALSRDGTYLTIKRNLIKLEKRPFRSSMTEVPSPDVLNKVLTVRSNGPKMKALLARYRERVLEFEDQLTELNDRKRVLENQLFKG